MKEQKSNMYTNVKTWNPFKGCGFDCVYCKPSFQAQAKRQKHNCMDCYNFTPHIHPERLDKIPNSNTIFVCGNSDISFCDPEFTDKIIDSIKRKGKDKTFYFQSKNPEYFQQFINKFPNNVKLLTTLETNRNEGYNQISKAPLPSDRYQQFLNLDYSQKILTIEPIMDFDTEEFLDMVIHINPEYVYLGKNSRPKQVKLSEPSDEQIEYWIKLLEENNISVKKHTMLC